MEEPCVIDTNVLLVANGDHQGISNDCQSECIEKLHACQRGGVVVLDDGYRILQEYQNKTQPNQPKGVGDVFLKWLLQNQANPARVHHVALNEHHRDVFLEFPDLSLQSDFDPPDRKFAAVANAHPNKPDIWQAADSKWLRWWNSLAAAGVKVVFLCPHDARRFFANKFPDEPLPNPPS